MSAMQYQCPGCGYTYDEAEGDAREGFPPGTPWSAIPEDWCCPDCAVRDKPDFVALAQDATEARGESAS